MGKKSKPQTTASQTEQQRRWKLQLLVTAAVAVIVAIIGIMPSLREWFKTPLPSPAFALANPITRPDSGLVIIAQNRAAQREEPLNVEFDGYLFASAAQRQHDIFPHAWRFVLQGRNLPDSLLADGAHRVRVGFAGEALSDYFTLGFTTQPPIVEVEMTQPEGKPNDRIFSGKVASKLQAPAETMFVDVAFHTEGRPVEIALPVKRVEVNGITYFEFETSVQGLPTISPEDPRYRKPFFAIRVTDQAGNRYYQEESYAQFMAPGDKRFGINSLNDIEVQRLPVDLRPRTTVAFRVMPKAPPRALLDSGRPAIVLKVTSLAANINKLNWQSNLPEELRNVPALTLIYRDEKQLTVLFGNEYTDQHATKGAATPYRVQQTGRDGRDYTSNTAQAAPAPAEQPSPYLTSAEVEKMLKDRGLFDRFRNPTGTGMKHQYKTLTQNGEDLVVDDATGRMWQQGGSDDFITYEAALVYVAQKNKESFGGYSDWRLPTLLEAMQLMEPKQQGELYLNPIFDHTQWWIWTSNKSSGSSCWVADFYSGLCYNQLVATNGYVRLVR